MPRLSLPLLPWVLAFTLGACGGCGEAPVQSLPTALVTSPDQARLFIGQRLSLRLRPPDPEA